MAPGPDVISDGLGEGSVRGKITLTSHQYRWTDLGNELLSNFVYEARSGGLFLNAVDEMNSSNDVCDQLRSV